MIHCHFLWCFSGLIIQHLLVGFWYGDFYFLSSVQEVKGLGSVLNIDLNSLKHLLCFPNEVLSCNCSVGLLSSFILSVFSVMSYIFTKEAAMQIQTMTLHNHLHLQAWPVRGMFWIMSRSVSFCTFHNFGKDYSWLCNCGLSLYFFVNPSLSF